MPTRSEETPHCAGENEVWAATARGTRRSVFDNYPADPTAPRRSLGAGIHSTEEQEIHRSPVATEPLQATIDTAIARSFLYRFLAQAFQDPSEPAWTEMTAASSLRILDNAVELLGSTAPELAKTSAAFRRQLNPDGYEPFRTGYLAAFGHAARGRCPLNEIEYGDLKADVLFQPHRLADLAAFYRAFGLEIAEDAGERHDHICLELEFMCVLAAKEAYALEHQLEAEDLSLGRAAQKRFLREHLGRWTPAFARHLARLGAGTILGDLATFMRSFVEAECARLGVPCGNEDLLLRPVDEAAESLCQACGIPSASARCL